MAAQGRPRCGRDAQSWNGLFPGGLVRNGQVLSGPVLNGLVPSGPVVSGPAQGAWGGTAWGRAVEAGAARPFSVLSSPDRAGPVSAFKFVHWLNVQPGR